LKIEKNLTPIAQYWCRIPVKAVRGGIWVAIKPYGLIPTEDAKICESKLYKRDNNWFLDIVVERDIPEKTKYQNVIAIDIGIRHIVCSVDIASSWTIFLWQRSEPCQGTLLVATKKVRHEESNRHHQKDR